MGLGHGSWSWALWVLESIEFLRRIPKIKRSGLIPETGINQLRSPQIVRYFSYFNPIRYGWLILASLRVCRWFLESFSFSRRQCISIFNMSLFRLLEPSDNKVNFIYIWVTNKIHSLDFYGWLKLHACRWYCYISLWFANCCLIHHLCFYITTRGVNEPSRNVFEFDIIFRNYVWAYLSIWQALIYYE